MGHEIGLGGYQMSICDEREGKTKGRGKLLNILSILSWNKKVRSSAKRETHSFFKSSSCPASAMKEQSIFRINWGLGLEFGNTLKNRQSKVIRFDFSTKLRKTRRGKSYER